MTTKRHRLQGESTEEDARIPSHVSPAYFRSSEESAFSKIGQVEYDEGKMKCSTSLSPTSTNTLFSGIYPAFYSPMFTYPIIPPTTEPGTGGSPAFLGSYLYPSLQAPGQTETSATSQETSPQVDKNMFYYVDPRIPFTNYFLNLTKLLKSSSTTKEESTTTPLVKIAGEEKRAGDKEQPFSPASQISSPEKIHSPDASFSSFSSKSSPELGETTKRADLKIDVSNDGMTFPHFLDPHVQTPMAGNLIHQTHQQTVVPFHSGGIFHPALMSLPGTSGFRRYNPEKPPPVKKYKCDVCGKAFSRSNTLVTHKVNTNFIAKFLIYYYSLDCSWLVPVRKIGRQSVEIYLMIKRNIGEINQRYLLCMGVDAFSLSSLIILTV